MRPDSPLTESLKFLASLAGLVVLTTVASLAPSEACAAIRYVRSTDGLDAGSCTYVQQLLQPDDNVSVIARR